MPRRVVTGIGRDADGEIVTIWGFLGVADISEAVRQVEEGAHRCIVNLGSISVPFPLRFVDESPDLHVGYGLLQRRSLLD